MILEINNLVGAKINTNQLKKTAEVAAKNCKLTSQRKISLVFVNNSKIKYLNKRYRHQNKVTDVLSFDFYHTDDSDHSLDDYWGEIIICYPQAAKQARVKKQTRESELTLLLVHGILHLAGYDHEAKKDSELMDSITIKIGDQLKNG